MPGRIAIDLTAVRRSRDFRALALGAIASGLGSQAALVAVPTQMFELTKSPFLVGSIGAAELVPMIAVSLLGGAIADRIDRRTLLIAAQGGTIASAGTLAALSFAGLTTPVVLFLLAGAIAGSSSLELVARTSMVPGLAREYLRSALAFNFGMAQLTAIVGPAIGALLLVVAGYGAAYATDAAMGFVTTALALLIRPQPPASTEHEHPPILRSIREGLSFVRHNNALLGSFVIDLFAMTFGMPRALFPILSLNVYHSGKAGIGALYSAAALGATVAALTTGWLERARRLGRIVIVAVLVWGAAIALAGLMGSLAPAALMLAIAGAADSVSAVCRSTINQTVTPEEMRGRMSSVFGLVVTGGVRLGDIEAGLVASLATVEFSVVSGGLACIAGVGLVVLAFPKLVSYDAAARHVT
jgi:MFS family permease